MTFDRDVVIVGGCGHAGLPLGIALADAGVRTALYDIDATTVKRVNAGEMPFTEVGAQPILETVLDRDLLIATTEESVVGTAEYVIVVIGTPVDEHLNPDPQAISRSLDPCIEHMRGGQMVILRSTVYPGVTAALENRLRSIGDIDVAFCPERIAEGQAMVELHTLPQLVGARTERAGARAEALFRRLTDDVLHLSPEEAELAKLFTNSWRYIKFAVANQLFMMATDFGVDFENLRRAIVHNYPRAADLPGAGFAAGPCLLKDTMQLAAFNNNNFSIGHAAMMINEGLPLFVVAHLERSFDLPNMTVGILGMAFKGDSDDTRSSLSYKLKRILAFKSLETLTSDPYVTADPELLPLDQVVARSDVLIIGAPHSQYRELDVDKPIVDIWGLRGRTSIP